MVKSLNETHILDVLRGQAGPKTQAAVYARVLEDAEFARTYEFWAQTLGNLDPAREETASATRALVQATLEALVREDEKTPVSLPVSPKRSPKPLHQPWFGTGFGPVWASLATSVAAMVLIVLSVSSLERVYERPEPAENVRAERLKPVPAISTSPVVADLEDVPTQVAVAPWEPISQAIAAVPEGSVFRVEGGRLSEPMRITKSLTVVAAARRESP